VLERVLKTISRYNMLAPASTRVLAAVSGGADSVCMLHALREAGVALAGVSHFNHKLRGEASEEDERFVAAMAARLGLPFYRAEARAGELGGNLEQASRVARRAFFLRLIRDGAADRIATAHTRDDQAETVLFRVLRGSGLAGLAGIHPVTADGLIRPLIEVTRAEVEEFLRARGIEWRVDASNRDPRFARNRIRHDLMPRLEREWNPRIVEALAQLGDLAFEEERWWATEPRTAVSGLPSTELNAGHLATMPRALARRIVRRAIERAKGDLRGVEFSHIELVLDLAARQEGDGHAGFAGIEAVRSFDWMRISADRFAAPPGPIEVTVPGTYPAPDGLGKIRLEVEETFTDSSCANLKVDLVDDPAPFELRGWRPGDHYRPVGTSRDHKLKEMFHSARIPSWRRPSWPILVREGRILWTRGFGAAEEVSARAGSGPVLRIWDTHDVTR
jgi:tRNA(Ile)-lysidine synthase